MMKLRFLAIPAMLAVPVAAAGTPQSEYRPQGGDLICRASSPGRAATALHICRTRAEWERQRSPRSEGGSAPNPGGGDGANS